MHICALDGEKITNRQTLHDILSSSLGLPEWYGRNLDALYDCLTEIQEETEIWLLNEASLEKIWAAISNPYSGYCTQCLRKILTCGTEEPNKYSIYR